MSEPRIPTGPLHAIVLGYRRLIQRTEQMSGALDVAGYGRFASLANDRRDLTRGRFGVGSHRR